MTYCDWAYIVGVGHNVGSNYLSLYQYFSSALPSPWQPPTYTNRSSSATQLIIMIDDLL